MKTITPLHSRANVVPRADVHNALHGMENKTGYIDTEIFGRVHVGDPIQYRAPAPRDSFAFGEIKAMGLRAKEFPVEDIPEVQEGDLIGLDIFQTGHQIEAGPYYERAEVFWTLPWKEILCVFRSGATLPVPVGWHLMVEQDEIATRRLLFSSAGVTLAIPDGAIKAGVRSNKNPLTKVRLTAGKVVAFGQRAAQFVGSDVELGDWALYNPLDAVSTRYPAVGRDGKARVLAFVKFPDLEQVVKRDDATDR